jgi:hypothetical protein
VGLGQRAVGREGAKLADADVDDALRVLEGTGDLDQGRGVQRDPELLEDVWGEDGVGGSRFVLQCEKAEALGGVGALADDRVARGSHETAVGGGAELLGGEDSAPAKLRAQVGQEMRTGGEAADPVIGQSGLERG